MHTPSALTDPLASIACPICGGAGQQYRFTRNDHTVFGCPRCQSEYLYPQPTDDVLNAIYNERYFLGEREFVEASAVAELKQATARSYLDEIQSIDPRVGLNLLEIGCGSGDFLVEAQSRGMSVQGIEYSLSATATANRRLGAFLVQVGSIDTVPLAPAAFDVIAFSDVIEHVRDPRRFVERTYRCLRPGGSVFAVTPSLESWSRKLMGKAWMEYKVEHLFYFGRKSLAHLFVSAGFENIRFLPNYKTLSFEYINAHFRRFPVPLWTPLLGLIGHLVPPSLARKHVRVVASGLIALARKPVTAPEFRT